MKERMDDQGDEEEKNQHNWVENIQQGQFDANLLREHYEEYGKNGPLSKSETKGDFLWFL